jgi:hypothetical protein
MQSCLQEEDIAMLGAQQYYIEHGADLNPNKLLQSLPSYLPDSCLAGPSRDKALDKWGNNVTQAFKKVRII